jgi:hypothetical protein
VGHFTTVAIPSGFRYVQSTFIPSYISPSTLETAAPPATGGNSIWKVKRCHLLTIASLDAGLGSEHTMGGALPDGFRLNGLRQFETAIGVVRQGNVGLIVCDINLFD